MYLSAFPLSTLGKGTEELLVPNNDKKGRNKKPWSPTQFPTWMIQDFSHKFFTDPREIRTEPQSFGDVNVLFFRDIILGKKKASELRLKTAQCCNLGCFDMRRMYAIHRLKMS